MVVGVFHFDSLEAAMDSFFVVFFCFLQFLKVHFGKIMEIIFRN